jgi:hypothetical protein
MTQSTMMANEVRPSTFYRAHTAYAMVDASRSKNALPGVPVRRLQGLAGIQGR